MASCWLVARWLAVDLDSTPPTRSLSGESAGSSSSLLSRARAVYITGPLQRTRYAVALRAHFTSLLLYVCRRRSAGACTLYSRRPLFVDLCVGLPRACVDDRQSSIVKTLNDGYQQASSGSQPTNESGRTAHSAYHGRRSPRPRTTADSEPAPPHRIRSPLPSHLFRDATANRSAREEKKKIKKH
ncbi:hypothetical protein SCHPADRAFT_904479 [Schizopora paradoxa]|uniref:Uncharacterized protein n=1 Tax=Schizopora paradoxa TaxID=27342 RepID=A0A0H2RMS4_9AGAM|nr:hypothetical protein SCHPADRAFT_904479 [Schizopora paradoxa]